jgi:hypothetical protein
LFNTFPNCAEAARQMDVGKSRINRGEVVQWWEMASISIIHFQSFIIPIYCSLPSLFESRRCCYWWNALQVCRSYGSTAALNWLDIEMKMDW